MLGTYSVRVTLHSHSLSFSVSQFLAAGTAGSRNSTAISRCRRINQFRRVYTLLTRKLRGAARRPLYREHRSHCTSIVFSQAEQAPDCSIAFNWLMPGSYISERGRSLWLFRLRFNADGFRSIHRNLSREHGFVEFLFFSIFARLTIRKWNFHLTKIKAWKFTVNDSFSNRTFRNNASFLFERVFSTANSLRENCVVHP